MTSKTLRNDVLFSGHDMISGMNPLIRDETYHFCSTTDAGLIAASCADALGIFLEDEGTTLILSEADAVKFGFALVSPMRRIVLEVFSALDGVGLTAAVSTALAENGIACNMVAAFHHDHVFVPAHLADAALACLKQLQRDTASNS